MTTRRRSRRPPTIALVGPDGSGKSTIAHEVVDRLPMPARYLYMGVNLESSHVMLPTTRLVLAGKRRRGGRGDLTARVGDGHHDGRWTPADSARSVARIGAWIAEETFRAIIASRARDRGELVVFDRHFFCDYYATDVRQPAPGEPPRRLASRIHGAVLRRWYPRPDLTILLDAPADVLYERKHEGPLELIEERRRNYLALDGVLPAFVVVDANRPLDEVVADVVTRIEAFADSGSATTAGSTSDDDGRAEPITGSNRALDAAAAAPLES